MKPILRVYVNGKLKRTIADPRQLYVVKLYMGDLVDAVMLDTRVFVEFEADLHGYYRFAISKTGEIEADCV